MILIDWFLILVSRLCVILFIVGFCLDVVVFVVLFDEFWYVDVDFYFWFVVDYFVCFVDVGVCLDDIVGLYW